MSDRSAIEWTDATWNPVSGCELVSSGCAHCYAKTLHDQRHTAWSSGRWPSAPAQYHVPFETVQCHLDRLAIPLSWQRPRKIFVNSMSDLFHADVPFEFISEVFATMARCERHAFQILTKRPDRMYEYCRVSRFGDALMRQTNSKSIPFYWPLRNVWLGVSVEHQAAADARVPLLLQTPAAVRFLSAEPLLGRIDLLKFLGVHASPYDVATDTSRESYYTHSYEREQLHQVIVGGESGAGARPMHPDWARALRNQCEIAGIAFFFKQWGEFAPDESGGFRSKARDDRVIDELGRPWKECGGGGRATALYKMQDPHKGRLLDGREWNEYPRESCCAGKDH